MRDLVRREFWTAAIPLWRVIIIVVAIGTLPGAGAAWVLSTEIEKTATAQLERSQAQVRAGCERTNHLRGLLNRRSDGLAQLQEGVIDFMRQARTARMDRKGTSYDPKLADLYQRDISKVARVRNEQLPLIDCRKAFKFVRRDRGRGPRATTAAVR